MSANKRTLFHWKIDDFDSKRKASWRDKTALVSDNFSMVTRPSVHFALLIDSNVCNFNKHFAIILKELNDEKPVNFNAKVWLENENGQKFGYFSIENLAFSKIGDMWNYSGSNEDDYKEFVEPLRNKREALFVCCELIDLDEIVFSTAELSQAFRHKNWSLYESEIYDAVIKIGKKEFKILKSFLMGQSEVFKQMFLSNFREGFIPIIQINDVSEKTMFQLIKWFYTEQVEDWSTVEDLFAAAEKFDIFVLKKTCAQHLISTLCEENAFQRLVLAVNHNSNVLKEAALNFISNLPDSHYIQFLSSEEWVDFSIRHNTLAKEVSSLVRQKFNN